MPADIIQAHYDSLQEIARMWGRAQERHADTKQRLRRHVDQLWNGGWEGRGSEAFFAEMEQEVFPALDRLILALGEGQRVTLDIIAIFREAEEEAARPFQRLVDEWMGHAGPGGGGAETAPHANKPGWWDRFLDVAEKIIDKVDDFYTWQPAVALPFIIAGIRAGSKYPGQVIIDLPDWLKQLGISRRWLRGLAGMSERLTHIKGANIAKHIAGRVDVGPIDWAIFGIKGTITAFQSWNRYADEYASYHDPTREISARIVDGVIAFMPATGELVGGVAGWKVGAYGGAAFGGVIAGPPGAVVGAVVGGVGMGIFGDWLGEKVFEKGAEFIEESLRDDFIAGLDNYVIQPMADGIDAVMNAFQGSSPQPQPGSSW